MQKDAVLIIFTKNPVEGKVKTRLADTVGDQRALEIYKKLLAYTCNITRLLEVDKQVWYSRYIPEADEWNPCTFSKKLQIGDGLGERMKHAFQEVFGQGYGKAVIIGSDCAELTAELIQNAYNMLSEKDIVIGPSADGGYYLLGMKTFLPQLFENILWSTPSVLHQTLQQAEKQGLTLHLLPKLNDVDNAKDWDQVKDRF